MKGNILETKKVLKALLSLQIALGELQACLIDIDRAIRELLKKEDGKQD